MEKEKKMKIGKRKTERKERWRNDVDQEMTATEREGRIDEERKRTKDKEGGRRHENGR